MRRNVPRSAAADSSFATTRSSPDGISPELALVDPELAEVARRRLPPPDSIFSPRSAAADCAPGVFERSRRAVPTLTARWPIVLLAMLVAAATAYGGVRWSDRTGSPRPALPSLASGGYVSPGTLSLQVRDGRETVESVTLKFGCVGRTKLPSLPLQHDLTFTFHGRVHGSRAIATVDLAGAFTAKSSAIIVVRVHGPGCSAGPRRIVARLS